jgi:hypothetical protein
MILKEVITLGKSASRLGMPIMALYGNVIFFGYIDYRLGWGKCIERNRYDNLQQA